MLDETQKKEYVDTIAQKGYIEISHIFSKGLLEKVQQTIEQPLNKPTVNGQKGYIKKNNIRFLFATLSWGKEIIELYTQPDLIDMIDRYVGDQVHLSNYRIYRTFPSRIEKMHWHVDNKIDIYDETKNTIVHQMRPEKGIIMIMYLSDVEDGGFQIVEGSHHWSIKEDKESWNDREQNFKDKIVTFNNRKMGTVILYDYRCIHRAKPYQGGKVRTSLFGQYSPGSLPTGEPIFLNTKDIAGLDEVAQRVLNFGKTPSCENWPLGDPGEIVEDLGWSAITSFLKTKAKKAVKKLGFYRR